MTGRERVMMALNHQEPDRVPLDLAGTRASGILSGAYDRLKRYLGVSSETLFLDETSGRVLPDEQILDRFDVDTRMLLLRSPVSRMEGKKLPSSYEDAWGVVWHLTSDGRYYSGKPPFAGQPRMSDLNTHGWPDPDAPGIAEGLGARAKELRERTECAVVVGLPGRVFSLGQFLCGFEDWLVNLITNPRFVGALLDRAVEIESHMVKRILQAVGENVDVVRCADDLGMQTAPLISPELYRKIIKPRQRRLYAAIKRHTNAKLLLHSDGAIAPLIGDFIDLGVDALNPVQVSAAGMGDTKRLKREFGDHIVFWGAIDTHHVLPFGSPQEVREEVRRRIEDLAPGGGYVLASVHNIQAEVPAENICAMFEAAKGKGVQ
jgi:uroporphyrinogen decarboxylase